MPRSQIDVLRHILIEAEYLLMASSGVSQASFLEDETLKRAFVRSLEIIGEATKQMPDDFRAAHPDVPWREMAGMRDHLIHVYFGVDYEIVWDVVINEIPELARKLADLLEMPRA